MFITLYSKEFCNLFELRYSCVGKVTVLKGRWKYEKGMQNCEKSPQEFYKSSRIIFLFDLFLCNLFSIKRFICKNLLVRQLLLSASEACNLNTNT
jgi:hypothetical protein